MTAPLSERALIYWRASRAAMRGWVEAHRMLGHIALHDENDHLRMQAERALGLAQRHLLETGPWNPTP